MKLTVDCSHLQIVMDCVANPPKEGDESYPLFIKVLLVISI